MDLYAATEVAYKNGFESGVKSMNLITCEHCAHFSECTLTAGSDIELNLHKRGICTLRVEHNCDALLFHVRANDYCSLAIDRGVEQLDQREMR